MDETRCPLCSTELEDRLVAPCEECGALPAELEHFRSGRHSYAEYTVFRGLKLVLCNFCDVNFGTFDPVFFGLPASAQFGYRNMQHIRTVTPTGPSMDKYCPACKYRLAFLRFVASARKQHAAAKA